LRCIQGKGAETKGFTVTDNIWSYRPSSGHRGGTDLSGFKVQATDGHIGKVDKHSDEVGAAYLVVDTGVWILGKHVLLPSGTIAQIDAAAKTLYINRTKDEIKNAPEFDKEKHAADPGYHQRIGNYYGSPHT
jgi:hypothetical protein